MIPEEKIEDTLAVYIGCRLLTLARSDRKGLHPGKKSLVYKQNQKGTERFQTFATMKGEKPTASRFQIRTRWDWTKSLSGKNPGKILKEANDPRQ